MKKAKRLKRAKRYAVLGILVLLVSVEIAIFARYGWGVARL